jgi:type VI secretion system protein ImpM
MIPGFFGKLPATGDFVTRRLNRDFVLFWDRLAARHLAVRIRDGSWPANLGLRFLLRLERSGPMAGVAIPSSDRVGRRFPLAAAASSPNIGAGTIAGTTGWFDHVQEILTAARDEETDADRLAEALADLPFPQLPPDSARPLDHLLLWTGGMPPLEVDPENPQRALEGLLSTVREAS